MVISNEKNELIP
jgi:hypothetical protein